MLQWRISSRRDCGEINDEYDDEERTYVKLNDRTYIFEAKPTVRFYKIMKVDPALFEKVEGDADTLAWFVAGNKREFPVLHERLDYGNYHFEVIEMNTRLHFESKVIVVFQLRGRRKEIDFYYAFIPYS